MRSSGRATSPEVASTNAGAGDGWPYRVSATGTLGSSCASRCRDVTGGFRAWRADALRRLPLDRIRSNGYVFQVEMAYAARRAGLTISEKPITFIDRRHGRSKMSFRIQVEAAVRVWQVLLSHRGP